VTRLLQTLRRQESGFTLIELLVACGIGTIVVLASFMLLDSTVVLSGKVTDRVDRTQRARLAMEQITRELRSQVCVQGGQPAIADGQTNSITFYAFMGTGTFVPDMRQIYWDATTNSIIEKKWQGSGAAPNTTFPVNPTSVTTLLTDVQPPPANAPLFAYYAAGATQPFSVPLSSADAANTSRVTIDFLTYASRRIASGSSIDLQTEVFSRTTDPNATSGPAAPACA
jgi:prepilin-type N-terminal cleavage/methylation domain-containing protein